MVKPVRIDLLKAILQNDANPIEQVKGKDLHASRGEIKVGKEGRWIGRNVTLQMANGSTKLLDESSIKKFFKNHHTHIPEYLKNNLDKKGNVQKALDYYSEHLRKEDVDMSKTVAGLNVSCLPTQTVETDNHKANRRRLTPPNQLNADGLHYGAFLDRGILYIKMPVDSLQRDVTALMDNAVHSLTDLNITPNEIVIIGDYNNDINGYVEQWKINQQNKQDPVVHSLKWHLNNGGISGTRNEKIAMLSGLKVVDKPWDDNANKLRRARSEFFYDIRHTKEFGLRPFMEIEYTDSKPKMGHDTVKIPKELQYTVEWVSLKKNEDRQLIGLHLYRAESGYYLYAKGEDGSTKLTKEKFAKLMNEAADLLPVGCNIAGVVGDDAGLALFNEWKG